MKQPRLDPAQWEEHVLRRAREGMAPSAGERERTLRGIAVGLSIPPAALLPEGGATATLGGPAAATPGMGAEACGSAGADVAANLAGSPGAGALSASGTSLSGTSTAGAAGIAAKLAGGAAKLVAATGGVSLKASLVGVATAIAVGAGGYAMVREPTPVAPASAPSVTLAAPPASLARTTATAPAVQSASDAADLSGSEPRSAMARPPEVLRPVDTATKASPPSNKARRASTPTPATAKASPTRELVALREAQSALARGDGAAALRSMQRLDEQQPGGVLGAERAVTRILALCRLGRVAEARALAQRTLGENLGTSLYGKRLAASCAASTRSE